MKEAGLFVDPGVKRSRQEMHESLTELMKKQIKKNSVLELGSAKKSEDIVFIDLPVH